MCRIRSDAILDIRNQSIALLALDLGLEIFSVGSLAWELQGLLSVLVSYWDAYGRIAGNLLMSYSILFFMYMSGQLPVH